MSVILATAGYDHKIRFWEAPSGICSRTLRFPDSQINCLEITPDKKFLAAAGNPHIRLFEINSSNHNPLLACEGHTASVTGLGFQREGRWMYSSSEDGTVKIWDLRSPGFQVRTVKNGEGAVRCAGGECRASFPRFRLLLHYVTLAVRRTSFLFSFSLAHLVSLISFAQRSFNCNCPVNSVALHPNQAELISGDEEGNIRVWDLSTSECIKNLVPVNDVPIRSVSIGEDAQALAAANQNAEVFVWNPVSSTEYKPVTHFCAHETGYCIKAKISPDCNTLVTTGSDKTARLWDTATWNLQKTLAQHQQWVWDAVFSADSSYLVTASSDHTARLWSLKNGEVVRQYTGHQSAVICVALNDST